MNNIVDLLIIGGGPIGLYANQYALKTGLKTRVIEKSAELGGKLKSVYPENPIENLGGVKTWQAGKLIDNMISHTEKYKPDYRLNESVQKIQQKDLVFTVTTDKGKHKSHAVLITTGRGIYLPPSLANLSFEEKEKAGLLTNIKNESALLGKNVVVIGGSHETVGWAIGAANVAGNVLIINWRFIESFASLEGSQAVPPNMDILEPYGLLEVSGDQTVTGIKVYHVETGEEKEVAADVIIMARGYLTNLSDIEKFDVALEKNGIKVDDAMHTSKAGIFAAGDSVYYPGKKRLISTGTNEAARAIESIEKYIQAIWGKNG